LSIACSVLGFGWSALELPAARWSGWLSNEASTGRRPITAIKTRIRDAVNASGTSLVELHGVGHRRRVILAQVGEPARFPTPTRSASYNGTAPVEGSVTQIANDTLGRFYYQRKFVEGMTKKEALRALKRRISDTIWRQFQVHLAAR
jgi:transposase